MVCVHGGAWVSGDRFATAGFAERVAATGIVIMAIDTRLSPQYPYPAAVADVNCATRWLKYHAGFQSFVHMFDISYFRRNFHS